MSVHSHTFASCAFIALCLTSLIAQVLQTVELNAENEPVDKNFMGQVRAAENIKDLPKQVMKQVMPFASFVMKQVGFVKQLDE